MSKSRFTRFADIAEMLGSASKATTFSRKQLARRLKTELKSTPQLIRDTYQACLGRLPEPEFALNTYDSTDEAVDHIVAALTCEEFLTRIPEMMLEAFPQAPRCHFVHIPKTGGTDIKTRMRATGHFFWDLFCEDPEWLEEIGGFETLFADIGAQARSPSRRLMIGGHYPTVNLLARQLVRSDDQVFTVIRNPEEIVLSWLNYTLTVLLDCPERQDGRGFAAWLEEASIAPPTRESDVTAEMIAALLGHPELIGDRADIMLRYLSSDGTISSAIANIKQLNMQVVHLEVLEDFMRQDLDMPPTDERANVSRKFIERFDDLPAIQRAQIKASMCASDTVLYDVLRELAGNDGVVRPMRDLRGHWPGA